MADIDKNPATLLAEQAALDPPQRRDVDVAAALRKVTETFAGVPDGRDTANALPAAGQHARPRLTCADPASNQTGWESEQLEGS